ncbi:MAG: nitroreductase [Gammaproteobacteria bacterium]|nr:nitroreductase [Gammaproteobacteria bacterium]
MNVTDAVKRRKSVRAFLDKPVSDDLIRQLIETAARAPSGGNLQPWHLFVINGPSMTRFREFLQTRTDPEIPPYTIYPEGLDDPYQARRLQVAETMYASLGIAREDKARRHEHLMSNFDFFGAQAAAFCFVDKQMGPPQWSDLGMYLQTFMLLATEAGLATCPQEAWSFKAASVSEFVGAGNNLMLFCGIAIGYEDTGAPVNQFQTEREDLPVWAKFIE